MKKIAYITGARSEFGLESRLLEALDKNKSFKLQLYATGMHLMPQYGNTINEIRSKFSNVGIIDVKPEGDRRQDIVIFASKLMGLVVKLFSGNKPDLVIVHGDRAEMLAVAVTCFYLGIPIAHVHGGDKTATIDDSTRHAITKLSHIHFPATRRSAKRIKDMGEDSWRIHPVGALDVDSLLNSQLISREEILKFLEFKETKFFLVTQHPVSGEEDQAGIQMKKTLSAIKKFNLPVVVLYPNADPGSKRMIEEIEKERNNPLFRIYPNVDYLTCLALEKETSVWIGNNSAAIVVSASFKVPVVNIGIRQSGREKGENVIDVDCNEQAIAKAIDKSLNDQNYLNRVRASVNPWGDNMAIERIIKILEDLKVDEKLLKKQIAI